MRAALVIALLAASLAASGLVGVVYGAATGPLARRVSNATTTTRPTGPPTNSTLLTRDELLATVDHDRGNATATMYYVSTNGTWYHASPNGTVGSPAPFGDVVPTVGVDYGARCGTRRWLSSPRSVRSTSGR